MSFPQERHDHRLIYQLLSHLRLRHKGINSFIKTLRDDYKLTLNDPDPIDDFLGIHFSHQDNGELHMSQQDSLTRSQNVPTSPEVDLKIPQHLLQRSCTLTQKASPAKNPGTTHP
jgi:hypothetical protein